jgi:5-dehydro-2-deoxygluconokinase
MDIGYDRPLYILPFDHRASFEKGLFGFSAPLTAEQRQGSPPASRSSTTG